MIFRTLVAAGIFAIGTPAFAHGPEFGVNEPLPANCVRHKVRVPAGKIDHTPPVVRCKAAKVIAQSDTPPAASPIEARTAND